MKETAFGDSPSMTSPLSSLTEQASARGEPSWLQDARRLALDGYRSLDPPQWRRTDLAALDVEARAMRTASVRAPARKLARAKGVLHLPLVQAAREHEDLVRPLLTSIPVGSDKWARLHAAAWSEGAFLHVEKGVEVPDPIDVETMHAAEGSLVRDVISLAPRSKLSLVARSRGASPQALSIEGLEMHLAEGAHLAVATLQDLSHGATLIATKRARLARDSQLQWVDGQFGAGTSVVQNETRLLAQGASLKFIGAFFGSSGQHMDGTTSALHEDAHTSSRMDMKGALSDDGYSANYSIVNIGPAAKNSSGHQHQETLLLSDKARADAIPKLDVENNDVSASHGATVGQVDPDQLFYLRSRGFSELAAKRLIVEGFFEPLLREIPVEDVREEVRAAILGRMRS